MKQQLKLQLEQADRRGKSRRPLPLRYPAAIEREYRFLISRYIQEYIDEIQERLLPLMPMSLAEAEQQTRLDSWVDDLLNQLDSTRLRRVGNVQGLSKLLDDVANRLGSFNQKHFKERMRASLGVNVFLKEPWLADELRSWSAQNVRLIASIPEREHSEISRLALEGVRQGRPVRDIQKDVQKRYGIMKRRAQTIARTEVSKLNGELTKRRQQELGIEMYYWRTSRDERVRDSHEIMDGLLCRYDDDSLYSDDGGRKWKSRSSIGGVIGIPGEDINCRCDAAPAVDLLLEELSI